MGTFSEVDIAQYAPNVVVRIVTPPTFTPTAIEGDGPLFPYGFLVLSVYEKGLDAILKDATGNLVGLARTSHLLNYHIKFYGDSGRVVRAASPPPPPPPPKPPKPPSPPGPPHIFTTSDAREAIPWVEEDPPFETIEYIPTDLVGLKPPRNPPRVPPSPPPSGTPPTSPPPFVGPQEPPRTKTTTWSPLELSSLPYFDVFPSAIYVAPIKSCISAPYFAPEAKRHLNGVMFSSANPSPTETCYLWEVSTKGKNREAPNIRPRTDGAVTVDSQRRDSENPYEDIFLMPGKWEKRSPFNIKNGDSLNAFSLILGIQGGGNENQPQSALWSIEIAFGDISLKFIEKSSQISVDIKASGSPVVTEKIEIQPTTTSYLTDHFGERPYILTFIPVWNGLLLSHGVPASSDWGSTITYFPKDKTLSANQQLNTILRDSQEQTEKQKEKGTYPFPPYIIIRRKDPDTKQYKQYKTPGIFIKGKKIAQVGKKGDKNFQAQSIANSDFNMGDKLILRFHRCGGVFKFVPIWFTPYSRYHYLFSGSADPDDLPKTPPERRPPKNPRKPKRDPKTGAMPGGGPRKPVVGPQLPPDYVKPPPPPRPEDDKTTIPGEPDVFKVESETTKIVLPIINFANTDWIDIRTHLTTIVKSASKPYGCLSMEFRNVNPDLRRPIQVWGAVVAEDIMAAQKKKGAPPRSDEGFLTVDDLPELRIKRFSISRSIDGANGEITWDRNDPVLGLLQRPSQTIGALRVGLFGGAGTTSGIVFTGLAMGNAQEDSPEDNSVKIPLRGREVKLDGDGGIILLNAPFFDGWDHRVAMTWLANYGGVPINTSLATPFRLITSVNILNPVLDFPMGTSVNQAMDTLTKGSGSLYYFDRYGVLIHFDAQTSTGKNWNYPDLKMESFSDEPDFQFMRNELIVRALVELPGAKEKTAELKDPDKITKYKETTEMVEVRVPIKTIPTFPWARYAVYTIPNIVRDRNEVMRQAARIAEGIARPRATSRCQIPPNAEIELYDTLNGLWIITSISHEADTQSKKWTMSLGVELFVAMPENVGAPIGKVLTKV